MNKKTSVKDPEIKDKISQNIKISRRNCFLFHKIV